MELTEFDLLLLRDAVKHVIQEGSLDEEDYMLLQIRLSDELKKHGWLMP